MTTSFPVDAGAVLVRATTAPPPPVERYVDVRPGTGTVFDGDRPRRTLAVGVVDGGRRTYESHEHRNAVADAAERLADGDVDVVRFGNRARLDATWPTAVVRGAERRLAADARRLDGLLVAWTDAAPEPVDRELYDAVLD